MPRTLRLVALLAIVLSLAAVPAAFGQSAFGPLPQAVPETTPTTATTTANPNSEGLKRWQEILIFMGGVGLIAGIAYAILSDARKAAPVSEAELAGHGPAAGARKAQDKTKARARAKAARAARKRNKRKR